MRYRLLSQCDELNKMPPNFLICCSARLHKSWLKHWDPEGFIFFLQFVTHHLHHHEHTHTHTSPWKSHKRPTSLQWVTGCISLLVHVSPAPLYLLFPDLQIWVMLDMFVSPVVCFHHHVVPLPLYRLSVQCITQVHMNNSWFLSIARSSAECVIARCR